MINTGNFPAALTDGTRKWFGMKVGDWPAEYSKFLKKVPSEHAFEEYTGVVGPGLAQVKTEGGPISFTSLRQGYTTRITNVSIALGMIVTYEAIKDGKYMPDGLKKAGALAKAFMQTKENLAALMLSRAFTSAYSGADGVELCSTAHVNKSDGSTWSNEMAVPADLSEAAIESLVTQIMQATEDNGFKQRIMPRALLIDPTNAFEATRIVKSVLQNDTANNAINALKDMNIFPDGIVVNRYYNAGNGAWFILTDSEGLVYQERESLSYGDDNDTDSRNYKGFGFERYAVGWYEPRAIFASAGAA
jgi:hypothetical protein